MVLGGGGVAEIRIILSGGASQEEAKDLKRNKMAIVLIVDFV